MLSCDRLRRHALLKRSERRLSAERRKLSPRVPLGVGWGVCVVGVVVGVRGGCVGVGVWGGRGGVCGGVGVVGVGQGDGRVGGLGGRVGVGGIGVAGGGERVGGFTSVRSARSRSVTDASNGTCRVWILRICSRASMSGRRTCTSRSKRPGRSSAGGERKKMERKRIEKGGGVVGGEGVGVGGGEGSFGEEWQRCVFCVCF